MVCLSNTTHDPSSKTDYYHHGNPHHDRVQSHPILALTLSQLQKLLLTLIEACSPKEGHREKREACVIPSSTHATYVRIYVTPHQPCRQAPTFALLLLHNCEEYNLCRILVVTQ